MTPSTIENSTEAKPTSSDTRDPYSTADRMSRPWSSVPSRKSGLPPSSQDGGVLASMMLRDARSKGLCGATMGANSAPSRMASVTIAAMMAPGERLKLCQRSLSAAREKKGAMRAIMLIPLVLYLLCTRRRGSTAKYSRSTTRLITTNMKAIRTR
ncbi:hypothetical protein D9M68_393560 [compost metagenome]